MTLTLYGVELWATALLFARMGAMLMLLPALPVVLLAARGRPGALLALALLPWMLRLVRSLGAQAPGPWLNLQLASSAKVGSLLGLLLAAGVLL